MEDLKILGARMAHHSPSPRPPLARSAARTASLTKSEPQPESRAAAATKRQNETTDGWNGRKVVMTTAGAASGAKQLENDDDAAADCQRGKGNFFPSPALPKAGAI